jgi:hypothetical protein
MRLSRHLRSSLVATALALGVTATAASAAPHLPIPIVLARALPIGTTVTVIGSVTVPSNAFDPGFAIQGPLAGIYVLDSAGADRQIGDLVEVTGTLVDNFGLLSIQPTAAHGLGHAPAIPGAPTSTGAVGEATEGRLLKLHGTMVGDLFDDGPFGFKLNIDDGSGPIQIFLYPAVGISTDGLVNGAAIHVTCFSNQFEDIYECDPPAASDFHVE